MQKYNISGMMMFVFLTLLIIVATKKHKEDITIFHIPSAIESVSAQYEWKNKAVTFMFFTPPDKSFETKVIEGVSDFYHIKISSTRGKIPDSIEKDYRGRLRADALVRYLRGITNITDNITVGVVSSDISIKNLLGNDWGIYGLADDIPGSACVISTFRTHSKRKGVVITILHEMGHCYGLSHCPFRYCLMSSGGLIPLKEGKPYLCDMCRTKINL